MKTPLIFYSSVYRTVGRGGLTEGFTFHLRKHLHTYTYFGSEKYFVEIFFWLEILFVRILKIKL